MPDFHVRQGLKRTVAELQRVEPLVYSAEKTTTEWRKRVCPEIFDHCRSRSQAELAAAATDPSVIEAMLRSERNMLWVLIALCVVNVLLAVWRPKMMIKIR